MRRNLNRRSRRTSKERSWRPTELDRGSLQLDEESSKVEGWEDFRTKGDRKKRDLYVEDET